MSFNFSLPTSDVPVTDTELPSHSGPCVITTGGVTFSLEQKQTQTLEEDEDVIFINKAKLYRYDNESKEWKERGIGDIKLLKHKENGKYRILMRRDKILKICANHIVSPIFTLKPHPTYPETCWIYQTDCDFSEEVIKKWTFAVRFQTPEITKQFKESFDKARSEMQILLETIVPAEKIPEINKSDPEIPEITKSDPKIPEITKSDPKIPEISKKSEPEYPKHIPQSQKQIPGSQKYIPETPNHIPGIISQRIEPLTLEVLYAEILQIKSTLKNMQEEWQDLKNIIIASQKNK